VCLRQGILRVALLARVQTPRRGKRWVRSGLNDALAVANIFFPVYWLHSNALSVSTHKAADSTAAQDSSDPEQQQTIPLGGSEEGEKCLDGEQRHGSTVGARREEGSRIGSVRERERVELRGVEDRRCASCASREAGLSSPLFWQLSRAHARV
jgi:hypothetical protein